MNSVFKWFTTDKGQVYLDWFVSRMLPTDFMGIERFFYCYARFCSRLRVNPDKCLSAYLKVDAISDIRNENIKLETQSALDYREATQLTEALEIIGNVAHTTLHQYLEENLDSREFKTDAYEFLDKIKKQQIQDSMLETFQGLSTGEVSVVVSEHLNRLREIETRLDGNSLSNIDLLPDSQNGDKMVFIAKTGIPCIDGDIGGIYAPLIYTLNAQSGGGKTRLGLVHFALPVLKAGKDVIFYETELTRGQTENILIAHYIAQLYKGKVKIPDTLMNKYDEMSPEQQHIYEAAKEDLFNNPKYGKFIFMDKCIVERLADEVYLKFRASKNVGLLVIDYLGYVRSIPTNKYERPKEKPQIIAETYEIVRTLTKDLKIPALCINQFNESGSEAAFAGKPIRQGMIQGGQVATQFSDYDLNMTFTAEQKLAKVRSLSTATKTRGSEGFGDVLFNVDMSISAFRQVNNNK